MIRLDWPASANIGGEPIPSVPDLVRMRADRRRRLMSGMESSGVDGMLLIGTSAVSYATGAVVPGTDAGRAALLPTVALLARGDPEPHIYTPTRDGAPAELPADHVHPPVIPDSVDGAALLQSAMADHFLPGAVVATDELTWPMRVALGGFEQADATAILSGAKICKTPDEIACIRTAQRINELAMASAQAALRPGIRQTELSAVFLRAVFDLGATSNVIDPIWQVMEPEKALGPWTVHGDVAFPTATTDRFLRDGDVIWNDSGICFEGYGSDFGRTWVVGGRVDARKESQFRRWSEVVEAVLALAKPGVNGHQLCEAAIDANGGAKPWLDHFYLAHGLGTDSAEMPLLGTDLGEAFDASVVMAPGMVLVLEPVIWDDGASGYRAEDIVAIVDDGWVALSDYPYHPYGARG